MPFVRSPQGVIGQVPDNQYEKAVKHLGYTPVSDDEVQAERARTAQLADAAEHPVQAAAQGFVKGAMNTFTAIPRALAAGSETLFGPNAVTDAVGGMTGENTLAALKDASMGFGGNQSDVDKSVGRFMQESHDLQATNPKAAFTGQLAGSIVGAGPLTAMGAAAGGATTGALGGAGSATARLAGYAAEGAAAGGTMAIADAADEAHRQQSYLTGQQILVSGGLGALLGGGLNLAGRAAGELYDLRAAAKRGPQVPDLEAPSEFETAATEIGNPPGTLDRFHGGDQPQRSVKGSSMSPDIPALEVPPAKVPEAASAGEVTVREHPLPSDKPDMSLGGQAADKTTSWADHISDSQAFPRKTRYSPGQRDIGEAGELDLPLGGRGGSTEPEELRAALTGEDLNSRARVAKVNKLLEIVPEGATPEYILKMTPTERKALSEFVGVPESSDTTWRALADAVAEREGISMGEPSGKLPPSLPEPPVPAPGLDLTAPPPYQPQLRSADDMIAAGQMRGDEHIPDIAEGNKVTPEEPYKPVVGGGSTEPGVIGESVAGKPIMGRKGASQSAAPTGDAALGKIVKQAVRFAGRRAAGHALGGALGGPFGTVAYMAGNMVGRSYDKLGSLATRSGKLAASALDAVFSVGARMPGQARMGLEADAVTRIFMNKDQSPEAAYSARMKELQALNANNGALLVDKVAAAYGPLGHSQQQAVISTTQAAQRGIAYLLQNAPQAAPDTQSLTPLANAVMPNRSDINTFSRVYAAVMKPETVLDDIKTGTVTTDQINAIRTVLPEWYQQHIVIPYGDRLRARDAAGEPLLPEERRMSDMLLGMHTGVDDTKFANHYAPLFAGALNQQQLPPPGPGAGSKQRGKKLGHPSSIAPSMQTQTNRMLGPVQ